MKRQLVRTASRYEVSESFVRAQAIGDWVFVSNTSGRNYEKQQMSDTVEGQTNQVLDNISRALEAVGSSLKDVVRRVVTIPNPEHAPEVMRIVGERFRNTSATNTVLCSPLGASEYLVEIEVTAYRGISQAETETINI
ncbi:Rid family hydrolase [Streptomyces sp. NBC_01716]|uniref:Rid family hydrolase n=1 Tax=Streptomyces sp. NBC_01716 TaxID=2975917 RepID=UPI002E32EAA3|nr:Rid family hydrolase [Streptomyces sp. NBC_01716]